MKTQKKEPLKIAVIIGKSGIIDNDIKHQLKESIGFYDLQLFRVSLTNENGLVTKMQRLNDLGLDIIVISRGSGE